MDRETRALLWKENKYLYIRTGAAASLCATFFFFAHQSEKMSLEQAAGQTPAVTQQDTRQEASATGPKRNLSGLYMLGGSLMMVLTTACCASAGLTTYNSIQRRKEAQPANAPDPS